ncbi:hypothetical protein KHS38_11685 [Mucilaginibacter sp. Bleaf8]|uniref:hypothetical protein n=1 Tax=Mucilaginibacter sp. Bleaf8 TaxID=2834430 RepID=UPI001BCFCEAB|nr:hypothetical protein [Mucilaginibacter sp. Bleaf8]MBS7565066.1 hypothetical protein [Mucilaginibacter sp. Bleaf8]
MKKTLLIGLLLASATLTYAQVKKATPEAAKSNIETISEQAGTFSKKDFVEIGKAKEVTVEVIKITDLLSNKIVSGIKLSANYHASYGSDTKSAMLDADEIDAFLKVIDYINNKVFTSEVPENSVEYNFHSRGGFSGGAYNYSKKWKGYVKLEKYDSNSYFFLDQEAFKALGALVSEAKTKL